MNGTSQQPTSNIAVRDKVDKVRSALAARMETIQRTLPAQFMSAPRFAQIVTTLCAQDPKLLDCKPASLIGSVLTCASLGLSPEKALGHAWFVPFKGVVTFIPGYKGLANLAWRSGGIESLSMEIVRAGDVFDYELGTEAFIKHKPAGKLTSDITHAYATLRPKGGSAMFVVLTKEEVDAVMARSPSAKYGGGPWTTDYAAMAKKSAFRRVAKLAPMATEQSRDFGKALELDERAELGLKQNTEEILGDWPEPIDAEFEEEKSK